MTAKTTTKTTRKKDRHNIFLAALGSYGNITRAAETAGLERTALYNKRKADPAFAKAWDEAEALGAAALEDEARRRAYEGCEEPVWHKGKQCGTVRKYSDTLLIVLLKAHHPEKYADRSKNEHTSPDGSMTPTEIRVTFVSPETYNAG